MRLKSENKILITGYIFETLQSIPGLTEVQRQHISDELLYDMNGWVLFDEPEWKVAEKCPEPLCINGRVAYVDVVGDCNTCEGKGFIGRSMTPKENLPSDTILQNHEKDYICPFCSIPLKEITNSDILEAIRKQKPG